MRGPIKLTTIECAVCSALIDVSQEFDPTTLIWRALVEDGNTCQNPPVASCAQARDECCGCFLNGISKGTGDRPRARRPQKRSKVGIQNADLTAWGQQMPFFADIDPEAEKPHEAFDRWREARRARRKALAHDRMAADGPSRVAIVPSTPNTTEP